jgi:hypothetical protein
MNNLKLYNDYLNEGLFSKQDDDLVEKIINKLKKKGVNLQNLKYEYQYINYPSIKSEGDKDIVRYIYRITKINPLDPYNEEQWDDETTKITKPKELVIVISKRHKDNKDKKIAINGIEQIVSERIFNKLWNTLAKAEKIEKERQIKKAEIQTIELEKEIEKKKKEKSAAVKSSFIDFLNENKIKNINEGWFISSRYDAFLKKLRDYVDKININNIRGGNRFEFNVKKSIRSDDPYGEEIWEGEDLNICVERVIDSCNWESDVYYYRIFINGERLGVSNSEAKRMWKYIDRKKKIERVIAKKQKEKDEDERLKRYIDLL